MRYMFMLYDDENAFEALPSAEKAACIGQHMAYSEALKKAGAFVEGEPLDHTRNARRVRGAHVENGPFTDSKEQLGGYYVVEAKDLDEALDWAAKCPGASYGRVEVRPVWKIE